MNKEFILSEIDRMITANEGSAEWYKNESRFAEQEEKATYQEARSIHLGQAHDLKNLRKKVEEL